MARHAVYRRRGQPQLPGGLLPPHLPLVQPQQLQTALQLVRIRHQSWKAVSEVSARQQPQLPGGPLPPHLSPVQLQQLQTLGSRKSGKTHDE